MKVKLSIGSDEFGYPVLNSKVDELKDEIKTKTDIIIEPIKRPIKRSEPNSIDLLITILNTGAAYMFFDIIKSYILKNRSINMEIDDGKSKKIKINAKNYNISQIEHSLESAKKFFEKD